MKRHSIVLTLLIFSCMILLFSQYTQAYAGAYCQDTNFCTCGDACAGGYEFSNLFNTMDGCPDGSNFNYEDVENVSLEVLNSATFKTGKTAEITVEFKIAMGDKYLILYNNGSGFYLLIYGDASLTGVETVKINKTIDGVIGNHTLRAIVFYPENAFYDGQTCGYAIENYYSDTDDITFYVENGDSTPPIINNVMPQGETFMFETYANLSADVSDNDLVGEVYANVTSPDGSTRQVMMTSSNNQSNATFDNIEYMGRYNFTVFAFDDSRNSANKSGYFFIDHVINITFQSPIDDKYYNTTSLDFNMTIIDQNYTVDSVRFEFNDASSNASNIINTTIFPIGERSENFEIGEENNSMKNLSQSFNSTRNISVDRLFLKMRRVGEINSTVSIRNDSGTDSPGSVIAYAIINASIGNDSAFYQLTLNQTMQIGSNKKYWITIENSSDEGIFYWSYSNNYSLGESKENNSYDYMFTISDKTRYERTINIESNNTIRIQVNNSAGISKIKEIRFYYDNTSPSFGNVEFNDVLEYGESEFIRVHLIDDHRIDSCLLEIDSQNLSMNREDALTFNYSYLAEQGPREFKIYFNDSMNHKNYTETFYFFVNDSAPPLARDITYTPNSSDDVDPNITIFVFANITDPGSVANATLFFAESKTALDDENNPNHKDMIFDADDRYYANFTPENETIYYFKIVAYDDFGNYNSSVETAINTSYDKTFIVTPSSLGAKGCLIGENASLGNFTINNTGDFDLNMSIYKSIDTAPNPEFTEDSPIIAPKNEKTISAYAICPLIEAAYDLTIIANGSWNLNSNQYSKTESITSILVAQKGGPYAAIEFINYPQTITAGSSRNNLTVKITNVGNETATNITFAWTLPSGWTTRETMNLNLSSLGVGNYVISTIYVLVPDNVNSGDYTVSAQTNWSNMSSQSIKKITVIANTPPVQQEPVVSHDASFISTATKKTGISSAGIAPSFNENMKFNLIIGKKNTFEMNITNNNKYIIWKNFHVEIEGFPLNKFIIRQLDLEEVRYKMTKNIFFDFDVPPYSQEERKIIKIIITAEQFDEKINLSSIVTFKRDVDITIQKGAYENEKSCVDFAQEDINAFESLGASSQNLRLSLEDAKIKLENGDLEAARRICMAIKDERNLAEEVKLRIDIIDNQISELSKEYYNTLDLKKSFEDAKNLFKNGMIDSSLQALENIAQLTALEKGANEFSVKRIGKRIFIDYWFALIFSSLLTGMVGSVGYSKGRRALIRIKKSKYVVEEKKILELMKKTQKEFYEDKIMGSDLYQQEMNKYRQDMAKIVGKKVEIIIYELVELNKDYFNAKRIIRKMIEDLQEMRFVTKEMGEESYGKILAILSEKASEIEEKERGAVAA